MNTKTKAIIAYFVVLMAGFAAGYAVHYLQYPPSYNQWNQSDEQGRWNHDRRGMRFEAGERMRANEKLSRALSLQEGQKDMFFNEIWQFHRGVRNELHSRREQEREVIRERYRDFRENVSEFLTAEQLIKLDKVAHPDSVETRRNSRMFRR